jgi:uncharacterized protein YegP (UPF0339 family)
MVIEVYRDDDGAWRWRLRADSGGRTLATSPEGYASEADARRAAQGFRLAAGNAPLIVTGASLGRAA